MFVNTAVLAGTWYPQIVSAATALRGNAKLGG
jgi:hypothetical protein